MSKVKMVVVFVVLGLIGFGAFRAAQVISAKKEEKKTGMNQIPLVDVAPVTQGLIEERILRTGDIMPRTQVTIYSKVQGWVENINVREGDRVKEGQVLATLDVREAEARQLAISSKADQASQDAQSARAAADEALMRANEAIARAEAAEKRAEEKERIAEERARQAEALFQNSMKK